MKRTINRVIKKISPRLFFSLKIFNELKRENCYFVSTGYYQSILLEKPVDFHENELPWMNYDILRILKERLKKDMSLLEYGSGFSTKFYSQHVGKVIAIEHDRNWFEIVSNNSLNNCDIIYIDYLQSEEGREGYSKAASNQNMEFHVIVIDGRDRVNCVKNSINSLTEDGILILDDSSRKKYQPAFTFMQSHGFKYITLCGLKPSGRQEDCTTIFYRKNNCFEI